MYYGLSYREGLPWCVYFGRYRQKPPWEHRGRRCPFHLLVYVISGSAVFRMQDKVYAVNEGDVLLIPQNTYYTVETKTFCEYYFFQFRGNLYACGALPGMLINNWGFGYSEEPNEETAESGVACYLTTYMHVPDYKNQLSPFCAKLHHYLHIPVPEAEYEFQLTFSQILLELSKCLRNEIEPANASLLSKIIYYIQENLTESLALGDIAEHFGISKSYLMKLFRQSLDTSVTVYINRVKMDHAAQLLRTSMMNVTEIAAFLGYHDPAYFSRVFKKHFGISPSQFK